MFNVLLVFAISVATSMIAPAPAVADATTADASAGDSQKSPEDPKLEETIVVTATRSERAVSDLPVSTTVITEKELQSAPSIWIDDVLRTIPGVQMSLQGSAMTFASGQDVSMHGLGGNRALVLLDGMPMHDPYYGSVQWQKVPIDSLRQVEVVRGGNASLFGNAALGGTINLLTRPVEESLVRLDMSAGTADTQRRAITVDHAFSEALAIRVSHTDYDSNGFVRVPNPGPVDRPSTNSTVVSSARIDYRPSDLTHAFFKANLSDIGIGEGVLDSGSDRDIIDFAAVFRRVLGSRCVISASAYKQDQEETRHVASLIGVRASAFISSVSTIPVAASGASLEWSMQGRGPVQMISFGVDVQQIEATEHRDTWNRTGGFRGTHIVDGRQEFAGLFGQVSWHPGTRLEILASGRLDYYKNSNGADQFVGGALTTYPSSSTTQFDPRVAFRYSVSDRSAIRGSVYRAFKAPPLREMYRSTSTGNSVILANPYLEPETLVGGEVGFEWAIPRVRVEANLYRSDIDGLQVRGPVPGQPANVFQSQNLGKARAQGLETMGNLQITRRWSLNLGYTYADSKVVEDPDPALVGKFIPEVPRHAGSFSLRFLGDGGSNLDVRGRILSSSFGESTNARPSPAHRVFDIAASYPLRPWLDVYGIVENVLDESYYRVLTPVALRSAQPRTVTAGIRMTVPTTPGRRIG